MIGGMCISTCIVVTESSSGQSRAVAGVANAVEQDLSTPHHTVELRVLLSTCQSRQLRKIA